MPNVPHEVILEQYQLRATFFAEKLDEFGFFGFSDKLGKIILDQGDTYNWKPRNDWGISEDAWAIVANGTIHPLMVFCHPKILIQHPRFLRYYRSISLIPQKGLQNMTKVGNIKEVENGKKSIPEKKLNAVIRTLNEFMSSIITLTPDLDNRKISGMVYATAGTTIDGSWRNQIGAEGERVIRSLILKSLIEKKEVLAIVKKNDRSHTIDEWRGEVGDPILTINEMKSVVVKNGSCLIFSSEPDIKFINDEGVIVGAMEIKAGIDPAGALERLGAMLKSFDNVLSITPSATTILVATCITEEVEARLRESNTVKYTYITTDVINNKSNRGDKLANAVRGILGLVDRRL